MTKFGEAICVLCGRNFCRKHPLHKYCHWQCQSAANKAKRSSDESCAKALIEGRKAEVDLNSFAEYVPPANQSQFGGQSDEQRRKSPKGRYVYAWFNDESQLPFYIGKGVGDRAWRRHTHTKDGIAQFCQQLRASSSGFRVEIIRENMTNEGAMLVESALIAFVSKCGGLLSNQSDPLCRRERPPLELLTSDVQS